MLRRFLLLVLVLVLARQGSAQYRELLHKSYAQRYHSLEALFYSGKALKKDSVANFKELKHLAELAQKAGDEELLLETRLLRGEYYMFGKQTNHDLFEPYMLALRDEADRKEILHLQIRTRQKLGYYYFYVRHKYGPGFDNYLRSYQLLKDVPVEELPEKQELVANIGTAYYQFGDIASARKFLTEALGIPPSYKKRLQINLTNTLGLIYRGELNYDSADHYFWKTFRMAEAAQDSTWMGIAAGNLGISFFHQGKYEAAIPLLETDIRASIKAGEIDNAVTSLLYLARINLHGQEVPQAQARVGQARSLLSETSNPYKHLGDLFPLMARIASMKGDSARAFLYSDSAHAVKDSLFTRRNTIMATRAEQKIELEKHRAEMQRLEADEEIEAILRNSLIGGIIFLVIIALLVINRQRLIHRQKQQRLELEKDSIATELELATRKLSDFTNHIREKNKMIEQFTAEMKKQKNEPGEPALSAHQETYEKLLQATILTDDQWEEFRHLFNKVHVGYLHRLREKLPHLSPAETRYFVLSKLNLTSKEMASMLGVRPDAIRLYRHRLRKKLHFEDDKQLESLVENI